MNRIGLLILIGATLITASCAKVPVSEPETSFKLKILHLNDHHSHLESDTRFDIRIAGKNTRIALGGFALVNSTIKKLSAGENNVLKLHGGDATSGTLYSTLFKGEADAAVMNAVCFDAFTLGNHEFDEGDSGLKKFLNILGEGDCNTSVLAANVKPKVGVSPLTPISEWDSFAPYVVKNVDGQKVGIIGITIAKKTKQSSRPDETTLFLDELITAQKYIDELTNAGVNHIVLLTHYQYENDLALARQLDGVDVIVGGDSHTLLGDYNWIGLESRGPYPTVEKDRAGNVVCVVQAWQYASLLGELDVIFDGDGKVKSCAGTPHLLLRDSFKRKNAEGQRVELVGSERDDVMEEVRRRANVSIVTPERESEKILADYSKQVEEMKGQVIGTADVTLCFERIPGQGASKLCEDSDTINHGSDITNTVAHAFLDMAVASQLAILNGGGVRTDLSAGAITIGDAYTLLPFSNTLVELDITGEELIETLEESLDYALGDGGSTGAYPYGAGIRWKIDSRQPQGKRLYDVEVKVKGDKEWGAIQHGETYKVVTNS